MLCYGMLCHIKWDMIKLKNASKKQNQKSGKISPQQFCHRFIIFLSQLKHEKLEMRWTRRKNFLSAFFLSSFRVQYSPTDANFHAGTSFAWVISYGHICRCTWALIKTSPNIKFSTFLASSFRQVQKNLFKIHLFAVTVITFAVRMISCFFWVLLHALLTEILSEMMSDFLAAESIGLRRSFCMHFLWGFFEMKMRCFLWKNWLLSLISHEY